MPRRMLTPAAARRQTARAATSSPGTTATGATCPGGRSRARRADPYRVWLSEIMLQQTTVAAVKPFYRRFLERFPTVAALAAAPAEAVMQAWAGLGYYSRARNLHACARAVVERHGGRFPGDRGGAARRCRASAPIRRRRSRRSPSTSRPRRSTAMSSGWSARLFTRRGAAARRRSRPIRALDARRSCRRTGPGDFAQALMDLGATICTPKRPACALCPWMAPCRARGRRARRRPIRSKVKKSGGRAAPRRRLRGAARRRLRAAAHAAAARACSAAWRSCRRAPGTPITSPPARCSMRPLEARWRRLPGVVRHVFTHFPLELTVFLARVARDAPAPEGDALDAAAATSPGRRCRA